MTYQPTKDDNDRIERYQKVVTIASTDIWTHMRKRLEDVPDDFTYLSDDHEDILRDIEAVEAEWILDEDTRQQVSLIEYSDDSEEES